MENTTLQSFPLFFSLLCFSSSSPFHFFLFLLCFLSSFLLSLPHFFLLLSAPHPSIKSYWCLFPHTLWQIYLLLFLLLCLFPLSLLFRSCTSSLYRSSPVPSACLSINFLPRFASSSSLYPTSCSSTFHPLSTHPPVATSLPVHFAFSFGCFTSWTHWKWVENERGFITPALLYKTGRFRFGAYGLSKTRWVKNA